jgi:hypothetical protein
MAAGSTYTPIATTTVGTAVNIVTFSSIASTYTDLVLVCNLQVSAASADFSVRVNNDSGTNYSRTYLSGDGSAASSGRTSNQTYFQPDALGYPTNAMSQTTFINFMNYANTTTYKTFLSRTNNASTGLDAMAGLWRSTAAINRVDVATVGASNWATGSTFTLYGIASA